MPLTKLKIFIFYSSKTHVFLAYFPCSYIKASGSGVFHKYLNYCENEAGKVLFLARSAKENTENVREQNEAQLFFTNCSGIYGLCIFVAVREAVTHAFHTVY